MKSTKKPKPKKFNNIEPKKIEILCWVRNTKNKNISFCFPATNPKQYAFIHRTMMDKLLRGLTGKCYLIALKDEAVLKTGLCIQVNHNGNLVIETDRGDSFYCQRERMQNLLKNKIEYASFWRFLE